ncbi:MAG: isoprenylcysteine carboxylmethyltransferase family protein [Candidatus Eremiobacteraeota bacterium]|nr:isoprenylcysteine carboxylmethyltransferase family protein [Candidatus Eremiobacteraeota bacterium]
MNDPTTDELRALIFKNRGALLSLPAALLALRGKPTAFSVAVGIPIAVAGEILRCWAVGYSGVTTRGNRVEAPSLTTAGPYAHVRNPLYVGNFVTAAGFAFAFTGRNCWSERLVLIAGSLGIMAGVYATIIPHEEQFLRKEFGAEFDRYCEAVPKLIPALEPIADPRGEWQPGVIRDAESKTLGFFAGMLALLALKALKR